MYKFKKKLKKEVLNEKHIYELAEEIGVTKSFMSSVLGGNKLCSKTIAYCITKSVDSDKEIFDYFTIEE